MKKQDTYIPQFDFNDMPQEDMKTCVKCGEKTLTLYDNLCFNCKKEIGFSADEINNSFAANENLYDSYIEEKIEKNTAPFAMGILWKPLRKYGISLILCIFAVNLFILSAEYEVLSVTVFSIVLFIFGILFSVFRKKLRHKKFCKFNEMTIEFLETHGWTCPFCNEVNYSLNHCKVCGVRPNLVVYKDIK